MSHFYGTLNGSRGEATRCGTKKSGVQRQALVNAAKVIMLTPHIKAYLQKHDPKALEQLTSAVGSA